MMILFSNLLWMLGGILLFIDLANGASLKEAKTQLSALNQEMVSVNQNLIEDRNKREQAYQTLALTEKKISDITKELTHTKINMQQQEKEIVDLQKSIQNLNRTLQHQQHQLSKHIQARYKLKPYQPIHFFMQPNQLENVSRMMVYYHAIIHAQQALITNIVDTKHAITDKQHALENHAKEQDQLQQRLQTDQDELIKNKSQQSFLIHQLNQGIQNKQSQLQDFSKDKERLTALIVKLNTSVSLLPRTSFRTLKHHLPRPVKVNSNAIHPMNQGLTFFASEGTTVAAVHAGKVVFSDWLRGYGLLLIIDHGDGFMSLYAHNLALLKHNGELVSQAEQIATVGHSGGLKQNGLYFEIRHHGKAISPSDWLS